jgi:predicted amidophosphoribosyltransferase
MQVNICSECGDQFIGNGQICQTCKREHDDIRQHSRLVGHREYREIMADEDLTLDDCSVVAGMFEHPVEA